MKGRKPKIQIIEKESYRLYEIKDKEGFKIYLVIKIKEKKNYVEIWPDVEFGKEFVFRSEFRGATFEKWRRVIRLIEEAIKFGEKELQSGVNDLVSLVKKFNGTKNEAVKK